VLDGLGGLCYVFEWVGWDVYDGVHGVFLVMM